MFAGIAVDTIVTLCSCTLITAVDNRNSITLITYIAQNSRTYIRKHTLECSTYSSLMSKFRQQLQCPIKASYTTHGLYSRHPTY